MKSLPVVAILSFQALIGLSFALVPSQHFAPTIHSAHTHRFARIPTSQLSTSQQAARFTKYNVVLSTSTTTNNNDVDVDESNDESHSNELPEDATRRKKLQKRVRSLAKQMTSPMPKAIASVLRDATLGAVDMAVEEVMSRRPSSASATKSTTSHSVISGAAAANKEAAKSAAATKTNAYNEDSVLSKLTLDLVNDAFEPMERSLEEMEASLKSARSALTTAKSQATQAIEAIQAAAIAQAEGAATIVQTAAENAERKVINEIYESADGVNVAGLSFEDVNFEESEMAPPFLDESSCLIPGEPVVRVEKAPENSRRIFAGIDIMASVDDVWNVLTQYDNLQNVIPNLVVNEVLDLYSGLTDYDKVALDPTKSDGQQCRETAKQMKGSLLKQVGGAKVAGINFSARTTLEVREWPNGMPDYAHYQDAMWEGKSRDARANEYTKVKLERDTFPRPFAISSLPTKDISMQSISNDDGEFRLYQGVWRMQPLPGCAAPGKSAMRLTYAVEISPRAYLPVQLVERRIVKDLCNNLEAIRDAVESRD